MGVDSKRHHQSAGKHPMRDILKRTGLTVRTSLSQNVHNRFPQRSAGIWKMWNRKWKNEANRVLLVTMGDQNRWIFLCSSNFLSVFKFSHQSNSCPWQTKRNHGVSFKFPLESSSANKNEKNVLKRRQSTAQTSQSINQSHVRSCVSKTWSINQSLNRIYERV